MIYGYARVSTKEQNEDRQIIALTDAGVEELNIFLDKESGKDFNRSSYKYMLKKLKRGDVVVIKSLDRFGRDYKEVQLQWRKLVAKGIDIKVLDMPLLDTTKNKDLIGTLISDIVLQLLAYVAQTERERIKERQREGIAAAMAKGIKFGRKQKYFYSSYTAILEKYMKKQIRLKECLKEIGCCERTFYTMYKIYSNLREDKG